VGGLVRNFRSITCVITAVVGWTQICSGATLEWHAPPSCSPDAFAFKFEQITDRQLEGAAPGAVRILVLTLPDDTWQVQVEMTLITQTRASTRILKGTTCADVSQAAAVAVAMALFDGLPNNPNASDSGATNAATQPQAVANEQPQLPVARTGSDKASTTALPRPTPTTPLLISAFAMATLDSNLLGEVALGGRAGLGFSWPAWELSVSYTGFPPLQKSFGPDLGIELSAHAGVATGCYAFGIAPVRSLLCVNYEAGVVIGEGSGARLSVKRKQAPFFHAVRPEGALHVSLRPKLDVRLFLGPTFALNRTEFVVDDGKVAHAVPAVGVRGGAGVAWTF
jgi:hypothetical protein